MKKMRLLVAVLLCGSALGFVAIQLSSAASQPSIAAIKIGNAP
jgi:Tfp pilus assembly protein FimV